MSDLNIVALVGRLSRDAAVRVSAKGDIFCQFGLAVNRSRKRDDVWEEVPHFFNLSLYGERAEKLAPYLVKGQAVSLQGHLVLDRWESQGMPQSRLDVAVDDLRLIGAAPGGVKGKDAPEAGKAAEGALGQGDGEGGVETDPDLDLGGVELEGESLV
jgi:single-strand DNA-binding protein